MSDRPESIPPEMIARLECIMEPWQWKEFIECCEAVKADGQGFGKIELTFTENRMTAIGGQFTRKPRRINLR